MMTSRNFFQLNDTDKRQLQTDWLTLAGRQGADEQLCQHEFAALMRHYEARGRHYHNNSHVAALLRWCAKYEIALERPDIVRYAIWFHDVIYRSRRHDNESQSAVYAATVLKRLQVNDTDNADIQALILATAKHQSESLPAHLLHDGQWFLDFDLAILASRAEVYDEYARAIRREYGWVPGPLFRRGRRQVLENFQARPQLFFTKTLRNQWETQARQNLARELAALA